jgi:LysM repeat protein
MKNLRQVFLAIMIALASTGLILGAFSLSLAEGNRAVTQAPAYTLTQTSSPSPALLPSTTSAASSTASPTLPASQTPTPTPSLTPSLSPTQPNCPPRMGWVRYTVQPGDSLETIAVRYRTSKSALEQANCLLPTGLLPGVIYVPAPSTQTPVRCGPPPTWIVYIVQPRDTLYRLSQAYAVGVDELQWANCMGSSTLLRSGQKLYIPPWAPRVPSPTAPALPTSTELPTNTPDTSLPSDTPTDVPTSIATDTPVPVPTDTPVIVPTDTLEPSIP